MLWYLFIKLDQNTHTLRSSEPISQSYWKVQKILAHDVCFLDALPDHISVFPFFAKEAGVEEARGQQTKNH